MNVSRRSLHYRLWNLLRNVYEVEPILNRNLRNFQPGSLCTYFWSLVLMFALTPVWAVLLSVVGIGIGVFVAIMTTYDWWRASHPKKVKDDWPPEIKQPSVIKTFIRARKQKVCPLITLVD